MEAIRTSTTYMPAKLSGLTGGNERQAVEHRKEEREGDDMPANMRPIHATPNTGSSALTVVARWYMRTRSKMGAERIAATSPLSKNIPPIRPLTTALYPCGWNICAMKTEKLDVPATRTPNTKNRIKKSIRSVFVRNCSPGRANPNAARIVWRNGGETREPEYVGGLGGCGRTRKARGQATDVMMARITKPGLTSLKSGEMI